MLFEVEVAERCEGTEVRVERKMAGKMMKLGRGFRVPLVTPHVHGGSKWLKWLE